MNMSNPSYNMQYANNPQMNQPNANYNFPNQNIRNTFPNNYTGNQMMQGPPGTNQPNQYSNQPGSRNN